MKVKNVYIDSEDDIEKCLNCKKKECTNCLYYIKVSKSRNELFKERNEKIMELFNGGMNGTQIARLYKLDQSTVNSIIKSNGGRDK